ncbi:MAG: CotH kinase family protein [Crocinitomicaceae bacterium]|nr:CotH kinase family protein [Crocinitomicaceae bacterium]
MKQLLFIFFTIVGSNLYAQHLVINELMSANDTTFLDEDGDFTDWVELYNPTSSSINLQNYHLSDGFSNVEKWSFPSVNIAANGYLIVFLSGKDRSYSGSELHTNFRLKSTGEYLILSNSQGSIVDHFLPVDLEKDYSYGRLPDGSDNAGFLTESTPLSTNNNSEFIQFIEFSRPQGFYSDAFDLEMSCSDSIYYTLDGSLPTTQSLLYETSVDIVENTANKLSLIPTTPNNFAPPEGNVKHGVVIRAQPFRNGVATGPVHNRSYFTQEHDYTFDVLSIVIDSLNLFDQDSGIYVPGIHYDSANPFWSGNYYQRGIDWERACSVTLFNNDGEEAFTENMGVRISGNGSRSFNQKSLRFYLRDEYGKSSINYPLFPDRENREVKRFVSRSAFTSLIWFGSSLFKDELIQALAHLKQLDIDLQMAHPTIVYINGEYWGIQTIKERQDEHYLHSLYGIDKDSVDIIDGYLTANTGSASDFIDLLDFVEQNDLSIPDNYAHVEEEIDVDNFIDYYILETYFGNMDWPGNNMRLWRAQTDSAKWRFLLYDLDATVGIIHHDPIERLDTIFNDQSFLFKNLLLNQSFKNDFICRYQQNLLTTFHPDLMRAFILYFKEKYAPELPRHVSRWNYPNSMNNWNESCAYLEYFFEERPAYIRSFLKSNFTFEDFESLSCPMGGTSGISVYPNPADDQSYLQLNNIELIEGTVSIYNAWGTLINREPVNYMTQHLRVADLPSGLYIIHVQKGDIVRTAKLLLK